MRVKMSVIPGSVSHHQVKHGNWKRLMRRPASFLILAALAGSSFACRLLSGGGGEAIQKPCGP